MDTTARIHGAPAPASACCHLALTPISTAIALSNDSTAVVATPAATDANEESPIPAAATANTHASRHASYSEGSTSDS
jgi:hypothetical protein